MGRDAGPVFEDYKLDESPDVTDDETDTDDLGTYDPHIGIPPNLMTGSYLEALQDKLLQDNMWGQTNPAKTRIAINRTKIQDIPWRMLSWARKNATHPSVKGDKHAFLDEIQANLLLHDEWIDLFAGLGSQMKRKVKKTLKQRARYENRHQPKDVPGLWTRGNSMQGRRYLVGATGRRDSPIWRPFQWRIQSWSFKSEPSSDRQSVSLVNNKRYFAQTFLGLIGSLEYPTRIRSLRLRTR